MEEKQPKAEKNSENKTLRLSTSASFIEIIKKERSFLRFKANVSTMKQHVIYFLLLFSLLGGCKEEEKPEQEAFIFGQWNFRCTGNCIQIYKYVGVKRYADQRNIPTSFTQ